MTSLFILFDIFGYVPSFHINKKKNYQTVFGGIVSFLIISSILYTIWHFGQEIIYKKKPNLIITNYHDADPMKIELNDQNFVLALGLQDQDYSLYINESIYTMKVKHHVVLRNTDGTFEDNVNELDTVRCSEKNITLLDDYFKLMNLENLYCLKNGTFFLQGDFGRSIWSYMEFNFLRCKNSTMNKNSCKSKEEIEKRLASGYFGLFITDLTTTPANFSQPSQHFGENIFTTFSVNAYRDFWMYLSKVQMFSDEGWLLDDPVQQDYYGIDYYRETWDQRDTSEIFFNYYMRMSLSRQVFNRSYLKVQVLAANTGGIIKFLLICGEILVYYFRDLKFKTFIIDFFFEMEDDGIDLPDAISKNSQINLKKSININVDTNLHNIENLNKFENNMRNMNNINSKNSVSQFSVNINKRENRIISKVSNFNTNKKSNQNINFQGERLGATQKISKNAFILINNEYKNITDWEIVQSACCRTKKLKNQLKVIQAAHKKLLRNFDWCHFVKNQQEIALIKGIVLDQNQNDILTLCLKLNKHSDLNVCIFCIYFILIGKII
jgi:hypothetical protein